MKYSIASLAATIGLASAAAVDTNAAPSPLSVSLTPVGNSQVKAIITNNSNKGYNIFHRGTILDTKTPVDKFQITKDTGKASFHGVKLRLATKNLTPNAFTALNAGESKEILVDLAEIYGLDKSGTYDVRTNGNFRYAELGSTELVNDILPFTSNSLAMKIDGPVAAQVTKAVVAAAAAANFNRRSTIQDDCSASQTKTIADGEARCVKQAQAAAQAATSGSATKFNEYFKTTATADRQYVAKRFTAVAKECQNTPGGILNVYCSDKYNYCSDDTFAYTVPADNNVIWCNQYWTHDTETTQCHGDDKTGTTIHEYTHANAVFSPGTNDYAYGYSACSKLTRAKALENADTYEYYANAIHLNC